MKKTVVILLTLMLLFALAACDNAAPEASGADPAAGSAQPDGADEADDPNEEHTLTLYAVWGLEHIEEHEYRYIGALSYVEIARGLTELTGLDFTASFSESGDDNQFVIVDWSDSSALFAPPAEFDEAFRFYDYDSMAFFMLDSMNETILKNTGKTGVFFSMNGGERLYLENTTPPYEFNPAYYYGWEDEN